MAKALAKSPAEWTRRSRRHLWNAQGTRGGTFGTRKALAEAPLERARRSRRHLRNAQGGPGVRLGAIVGNALVCLVSSLTVLR